MKRFIERATEGMNARFATNFSTPFIELLLLLISVLMIGTALGIGACIVFGDVRWQYFAVSYAAVAAIVVKIFYL